MHDKYYVYAIVCSNQSVYIGQTNDLQQRWKLHVTGKGARWTKKYPPVSLFYFEKADSLFEAMKRERELKKSTGRKKLKEILKKCSKHLLADRIEEGKQDKKVLKKKKNVRTADERGLKDSADLKGKGKAYGRRV